MNYEGARAMLEQSPGSCNVTTLRGLLRDALDYIDELRADLEAARAELEYPNRGDRYGAELIRVKAERDAVKADAERLAEALRDMWDQFAYDTAKGKITGGLSTLENCEAALAAHDGPKPGTFYTVEDAREQAEERDE